MRGLPVLACLAAAFFIWHAIQYPAPPAEPAAVASATADVVADEAPPPDELLASQALDTKPWGFDTAPISTAGSFVYAKNHPATPLPATALAAMANPDPAAADDFTAANEPSDTWIDADRLRTLSRSGVCSAIVSVARANDLPVPFFANLIWQESSFRSRTISPAGALGMAQFIPETAIEHGLMNPFEPVHALFASGRLLRKLHRQFGNLGLAAAAYNAGPQRVHDWIGARRGLPAETRAYVVRITGHRADQWLASGFARGPEATLMPARAPCVEVAEAVKEQAHIVRIARLMQELVAATAPPPPRDQSPVAALPAKPSAKRLAGNNALPVQKKPPVAPKPAVTVAAKPKPALQAAATAMKDQSRPAAAQRAGNATVASSTQTQKRVAVR
jgi:soluble lytic murein transglycosylase-like protein